MYTGLSITNMVYIFKKFWKLGKGNKWGIFVKDKLAEIYGSHSATQTL